MGWSIFNLSEWRLFEIVKYLIYLDCVAISTCAFLLYAEDNEVYKKAEDGGHLWLYNYLILGFNLAAPISIYFYTYDGYLYKIGLFVLFLFIAIVLRFTLASSFYFWHNIASFIGIALGGYLIFIIWYGKSEQTYRIPIHEFIGAKVTKQGSMVDRETGSRIRTIGSSPESPTDASRPRRSKSRSKSKSKSSRTSTSVTSPESAGGTNKATALFQKYFGPKKNKDDDVENKKVKSSDLGSRLFSPDTPPPKSKSRSKRSRGSKKSSEPQHSRQSSRRSHSGSRRRHSSRRSSSKHEDDDKDSPRRSNSRHGGGGRESSRRSKKSSRSKSGKTRKPKT